LRPSWAVAAKDDASRIMNKRVLRMGWTVGLLIRLQEWRLTIVPLLLYSGTDAPVCYGL
jgi:hypothetical protein